jgi:hypothetical protein
VSKPTEWAEGLSLSAGGRKLVGKAGIVPVRRLADKVGLTDALSSALVRRDFHPVHDRGGVLVSAACAVLLGARSIAGIEVMRQAALVLGIRPRPPRYTARWTRSARSSSRRSPPRGPGSAPACISCWTCAPAVPADTRGR